MSLDRRDVKAMLDADIHEALKVFANSRAITLAALAEEIINRWVRAKVHEVSVVAHDLDRAGIVRSITARVDSSTELQR